MNDDLAQLAELGPRLVDEAIGTYGLSSSDLGQDVNDRAHDVREAVHDQVAIGRKISHEDAELRAKHDLLPSAGYRRLRGELVAMGRSLNEEADRRIGRSLDALEDSLVEAAQPRFDPGREMLARQEIALALGQAEGDHAAGLVSQLALNGSRELVAVLGTSFGQTLLMAHGVTGRTLEETLKGVRQIAARTAAERGETPREIMAGRALDEVGKLGAAKGASGAFTLRMIEEATR
jgi:hypothetical protein